MTDTEPTTITKIKTKTKIRGTYKKKSAPLKSVKFQESDKNGNSTFFSVFDRPFSFTEILDGNRRCGIMDEEEEEDEVSSNNSGKHHFFDINKDIIEVFSTKLHRVVTGDFTGQTDDTVISVNRRYHHDVDSSGVYDDNDYDNNDNYNDNNDDNDDSDNDNDNDHDNNDDNDKKKSRSENRNTNRSKKSKIRKNIDNVTTEITNILNLFNKKTSINVQLESKTSDTTHVIINRNHSHLSSNDNDDQNDDNSSTVSSTINNTEMNKLTEIVDQDKMENNVHLNDVAKDQTDPSETESQPGYNTIVANNINEVEDRIKLFIEQKKLYLLERKKLKLEKKERQEERDRKKIVKIDKRYAAKITEKDFSLKSRTRTNGVKRTRFERNVRGKIMNMNNLNSDNTSSSSSNKKKNKSDQSEEEKNGEKDSRNVLPVKKAGTSSSILSRRKVVREAVEVDNSSHNNNVNNNDNDNNNDNNNNNNNNDDNNDNNNDNENEHHTNNDINKSPSSQSVLLLSKRKPKYLSFANLTVTRKKGPVKGLGVRALSDLPRSARTTVSTTVSTSNSVRAPVTVNIENAMDMASAIEKELGIRVNEVEVEKLKSSLESIENENENDNKSNISESDSFPHNMNIVEDCGSNSRNTSSSSSAALDNLFAMLGENNGNENTENEEIVGCNDTNSTVQSVCNDNDDDDDVEDDIFDLINVIEKNQKKRKQEELTQIERKKSSKKENERNEIFKNQQKESEKESRKRTCLGDDLESFLGA